MSKFEVWVDGSTKGNGTEKAIGGWGVYMVNDKDMEISNCGGGLDTTNQRMELTAAIQGIKLYNEHKKSTNSKCVIYTDSAYVYNCWKQKWYKKWEENGWLNSKQEPVANKDLWLLLLEGFRDKSIQFIKVKGHADNYGNIKADQLAVMAAERMVNREAKKNK